MLIKHPALPLHLKKKTYALYVLTGQEPYLFNETAVTIKKIGRQHGETDEKTLEITTPTDWETLLQEANSYSLLSEWVLLNVFFDKKTIDATGKKAIIRYLIDTNPRCLILLQAPNVPIKQWQWLSAEENALVIHITPLNDTAFTRWITTQLQQCGVQTTPDIPGLIHQYSQNNLLAAHQMVEKLALINNETTPLTKEDILNQLIDQSEFQLYELTDACLNQNHAKALTVLRQAQQTRTEPTLILWLLTQEVRQLIQLTHLLQQSIVLSQACQQLKIWPQRASSYQKALQRLPLITLYALLRYSRQLDERIKTSQSYPIWHGFDHIVQVFCLGETSVLGDLLK